ncbi:MAG: hypothetical protein NZ557_16075 [Chthonomonadaceae bacterium]|nr:hypothetical protein [Chthonomonadaceae bacterium]
MSPASSSPPVTSEPDSSECTTRERSHWFPPLFFLLLATIFLWRVVFTGEVFLPASLLYHLAPWAAQAPSDLSLPPWNPLRWDGIAQFYPWRLFAAQTLREGLIPLWNPYQFCGTPFIANSQSAVFYPPNWIGIVVPTAHAFGVNTLLHLTLCGWFTYLLLRRLHCAPPGALLGGVVYTFSAWQVAWLQLPTFQATSCWFPLLLYAIHGAFAPERSAVRALTGIGIAAGMMLLAGHLQIAFYGLLASGLWMLALLIACARCRGWDAACRSLGICGAGLAAGFLLAMPQLLPALELSRVSHRASRPTQEGYQAYREYALPVAGLVTLTLPDFPGADHLPDHPYWGFYVKQVEGGALAIRHNPAETANYVGITTLLLGLLAVMRAVRDRTGISLFFIGMAVFSLLLALGTPINALFYFGIPGFGQSGSPGRALVLWALAWAVLAGVGLDALQRRAPSRREIGTVLAGFLLVFATGLSLAAQAVRNPPVGLPYPVPLLGEIFGRIGENWLRLGLFFSVATGALWVAAVFSDQARARCQEDGRIRPGSTRVIHFLTSTLIALVVIDLFWTGIRTNPTARPETVYPETPGITYLKQHLQHDRILPANQLWSLYRPPAAVLPPNAGTVYRFRDVQGYDSLLPGQYKRLANEFARPNRLGIVDASPPEVGNMIFFQNPGAPGVAALGVRFILTPSVTVRASEVAVAPQATRVQDSGDMALYALPDAAGRVRMELPPGVAGGALSWEEDGPTRVTLRVTTPQEARLILADQWFPGWKARVDRSPVLMERAGPAGVFRAVRVPAGSHRVTFRYEPAGYRLGLYLACGAASLLTGLCCAVSGRHVLPARRR